MSIVKERDQSFFHKKSGILFVWQPDVGSYEPVAYEGIINDEGMIQAKEISKGTLHYEYIMYVRFSSMIVNKQTGKGEPGKLELYQWDISFKIIKSAIGLDSSDTICAISRQAGKTYVARKVLAFLLIFAAHHLGHRLKEDRYYITFAGVKKDLVVDHCKKMEPEVDRAVELFNMLRPETPIITPDENSDLSGQVMKKQYNRRINGTEITYSAFDGISLSANVNAGYTSHFIFIDEAQEVNDEAFNIQVKPFVTRTGGCVYAIGTTLPDDSNVLFNMYKDKAIPDDRKIFYDWQDVYECKKLVSEHEAEKYKIRVEKEIAKYGRHSDYVQTQYFCSFDIQGDRFITIEQLKEFKILSGTTDYNVKNYSRHTTTSKTYRIAGFDPATTNDHAALVVGIATMNVHGKFIVQIKNTHILNKGMEKISPTELVQKVAFICDQQKIDMIMCDATGNQEDRSYYLYKELLGLGCNTFVVPYSYGNKNKMKMMGHLEDSIFEGTLILPKEEYRRQDEEYDELIKEMCYLKKDVTSTGTITYKAPEGSTYYDDMVMALAQTNYVCHYIKMQMKNKKIINLGDGIKYNLRFNVNQPRKDESHNRSSYYIIK